MDQNHHADLNHTKPKKSRTVTMKVNRDVLTIGIALLLVVAAYFVGYHNGQNHPSNKNSLTTSDSVRQNASAASNRWTSVGIVTEVTESSIKVKDSRGQIKDAKITKDTTIVDRKGTKLTTKEIKKDTRVIISGTKDGNTLSATRIRIQQ